jgi:serine/threonine protein kinase
METLTGGNLFEYLIKRRVGLALEEIKVIVRNILKGLAELETHGIVHRDIKLENLMMREKGTIEPVIVDFGLAIFEDDEDYVYYQCGTPGYLSPEGLGLKKGEKLTPKSDIFSAGVVLHVLLAGRYLFEGKTPKEVF